MKISSLSVKNFRSITNANQLPISDMTILIGKNNEGKSNLLKALVICLNQISFKRRLYKRSKISRKRMDDEDIFYDFDRDFPLNIKKNKKSDSTVVVIDFELSDSEKRQFQKKTNVILKGNLRINFTFQNESPIIQIHDTENTKKIISKKSSNSEHIIFDWISTKIEVCYISTIRDSTKTLEIIDDLIAEQLSQLLYDKRYMKLITELEILQKPILDSMSESLTKEVSAFFPDVKKIQFVYQERIQRISRMTTNVLIDDGINTDLELKGDGLKSLMAISIIQYLTTQRAATKNIFLIIDEPESHLHPDAIHKLRVVLRNISAKNQVMISTHSPLLTNRSSISKNLLVDKSKVQEAKSINEIRDILGVKISDNLKSANLVLLVEGNRDKRILKKILEEKSNIIKKSLEDGTLIFDILYGVSHLTSKITMWQNLLCDTYAFLDHDQDAKTAFNKAQRNNLIETKNSTFCTLQGYGESEFEDLILLDCYNNSILDKYGIDLSKNSVFKNPKNKWSIRIEKSFLAEGKTWNEQTQNTVKDIVNGNVLDMGFSAIRKSTQTPILSLISNLENNLKNLEIR